MGFTYRGLKAAFTRHIITEEEVESHLQRLLRQNSRVAAVEDRPTRNGDEVVLDYAGYCDGAAFPGGTARNQTLVLGSGAFIPGFEEQLLDKVPGEKVTVKVTFPPDYHAAEMAGKAAEFHCVIHAVRVKMPYELDDVFAREVGQCESMEEMRRKLGESLQAYTDERGEMDLQERLLRQAADTLEFTPSEDQIEEELKEQLHNLEKQLESRGLTLDMYCDFMGITRERMREDSLPDAVQNVRTKAAVEQIVALEGLTVSKEDLAEAYAVISRKNHITMDQLRNHIDAELEHLVSLNVLRTKVMSLIRENAQVTLEDEKQS